MMFTRREPAAGTSAEAGGEKRVVGGEDRPQGKMNLRHVATGATFFIGQRRNRVSGLLD